MPKMNICVPCLTEMRCVKNHANCDFGYGCTYACDVYKCPKCGTELAITAQEGIHDPEYRDENYIPIRTTDNNFPLHYDDKKLYKLKDSL